MGNEFIASINYINILYAHYTVLEKNLIIIVIKLNYLLYTVV